MCLHPMIDRMHPLVLRREQIFIFNIYIIQEIDVDVTLWYNKA